MSSETCDNVAIFSTLIHELEEKIKTLNSQVSDRFKISETITDFFDETESKFKYISINDYLNRSIEVFKTYKETDQKLINNKWMPSIIKGIESMLDHYQKCVVENQRFDEHYYYFTFRSDVYNIERWIYEDSQRYISCPILYCMRLINNVRKILDDEVEKRCFSEKEYISRWHAAHDYNPLYDGFIDN